MNSSFSIITVVCMVTLVGIFPAFFWQKITKKTESCLLSFSSGMMLAASFLTLLLPGLDYATKSYSSKLTASFVMVASFAVGVSFIHIIDRYFHCKCDDRKESKSLCLFIISIMVHNFPEGMVVGIGLGGLDSSHSLPLALGIGLQNIPEGFIVAVASLALGYTRSYAFFLVFVSAVIELLGGFIGIYLIQLTKHLMPLGFGFASGAMLYVILQKMMILYRLQ